MERKLSDFKYALPEYRGVSSGSGAFGFEIVFPYKGKSIKEEIKEIHKQTEVIKQIRKDMEYGIES